MTDSVISSLVQTEKTTTYTWMRRLVWKIVIATILLMAVGSATRVMNAGLACPDWPLCYGQWIPSQQMNLQVFLEWFHRLDAALIGLSTLVFVGLSWGFRAQLPTWLPWASLGSLALILLQGALGGLTVIELLRFDIVTAHLGTAMLFLGSLLVTALCLSPYLAHQTAGNLRWLAGSTTVILYFQCLLGGLVGSQWAAHQCLAVAGTKFCQVLDSHLWGVGLTSLGVLATIWCTRRTAALNPLLRQLGLVAGLLLAEQILLGVATLKLHLQIEPLTVAHHTVGVCLWSCLLAITVLSWRDYQQPDYPQVASMPQVHV